MLRNSSMAMVSIVALLVLSTAATHAATPRFDADEIKAGLRTAAPEDDGFVDRVLDMVEEGKLSSALVQSTFVWARKQSQHQFQHFKRGLLNRVSDPAIRFELTTGRPATPSPPPTLGETVASLLRRMFSFLPSVHALLE